MKIRILFTVLLVALITAGCTSKPEQTAASFPPAQNFAAGNTTENTNPESGITQIANGQYPTSPEGVVQAFLATYGANPQDALPYLTTGAQGTLNSAALQFEGSIEGFTIDQAAVNPELPGAFIGVAIQVSGAESRRDFTLVVENGQWKIETVSIPAS